MAKGKVVQVIGTVVDVAFPPEEMPAVFNALELELEGGRLVLEVEQHVGNNWARCLALGSTDGLSRGVYNTLDVMAGGGGVHEIETPGEPGRSPNERIGEAIRFHSEYWDV